MYYCDVSLRTGWFPGQYRWILARNPEVYSRNEANFDILYTIYLRNKVSF
jgi:hypothetical protein